jgi:hypothetical protein
MTGAISDPVTPLGSAVTVTGTSLVWPCGEKGHAHEGHQRAPEAIDRHQRSMHMHLKSLLEVADEKYDEDDPALQENDDQLEAVSRAELKQLIERAAT